MSFAPANRAGRIFLAWMFWQWFILPLIISVLDSFNVIEDVAPYFLLGSAPMLVIMVIALVLGERLGE